MLLLFQYHFFIQFLRFFLRSTTSSSLVVVGFENVILNLQSHSILFLSYFSVFQFGRSAICTIKSDFVITKE